MSNAIFPTLDGMSLNLKLMPEWSTTVQKAVSQREVRIGHVSYPIYNITVEFNVLREDVSYSELQTIVGFFNARHGDFDDFLIWNDEDNAASNLQFGTGDGATTVFQLYRSFGGFSEPVFGNPTVTQVTVNGVVTAVTTSAWGKVTFASPPANGAILRWTGTFHWRVRFARPSQEVSRFLKDLWEAKNVQLRSVKP